MSRIFKPFPIFAFVVFGLGIGSGAAYSGDSTQAVVTAEQTDEGVVNAENNTVSSPRQLQKAKIKPEPTVPPNPWLGYENVCETFTVYEGERSKKGGTSVRYRRNRYKRKVSDQKRTRELVRMVAKEMGADPDIVETIASHESSWNPEAIHILNPDQEANKAAWSKFSYSRTKELVLEGKMAETSKQAKEYYGYKQMLSRVRLYKNNPFWGAKLRYEYVFPSRPGEGDTVIPEERLEEWASVWSYGYGLYGMNGILYTHLWDKTAPPWVMCGDEGIVATVTAIWALRDQQQECEYLSREQPEKYGTQGGSARGVIRRFARGRCSDKRLGKAWRALIENRESVDWDAHAELGNKFPRYEMKRKGGKLVYKKDANGKKIQADRMAIIEHMRTKAEAKSLLREVPLERKDAESIPKIAMK